MVFLTDSVVGERVFAGCKARWRGKLGRCQAAEWRVVVYQSGREFVSMMFGETIGKRGPRKVRWAEGEIKQASWDGGWPIREGSLWKLSIAGLWEAKSLKPATACEPAAG